MTDQVQGKVKLLFVKTKHNDDQEKLRTKVFASLRSLEKFEAKNHGPRLRVSQQGIAPRAQQNFPGNVKYLWQLGAEDVAQVATNARCVALLMKDGRVCRFKCASRSKDEFDTTSSIYSARHFSSSKKTTPKPAVSLQVLSDAEYAKRLHEELNRGTSSSGLLDQQSIGTFQPRRYGDVIGDYATDLFGHHHTHSSSSSERLFPADGSLMTNTNNGLPPRGLFAQQRPTLLPPSPPPSHLLSSYRLSSSVSAEEGHGVQEVPRYSVTNLSSSSAFGVSDARSSAATSGLGMGTRQAASAAASKPKEGGERWPEMGDLQWLCSEQVCMYVH